MNTLGIHSWGDVRALIYTATPVVTALLVTLGVVTTDQAALWAGLASAVAGPVLAFVMAPSTAKARLGVYSLIFAGQALAIGYGLTGGSVGAWLPVVSAVLAVLGGGTAAANTTTTPASPVDAVARVGRHAAESAEDFLRRMWPDR